VTYTEIVAELRQLHLYSVETALDRAVMAEAKELLTMQRRLLSQARKDAEEYYADEISGYLRRHSVPALTPDDVLSFRRKPTVWAVAHKLRDHGKEDT